MQPTCLDHATYGHSTDKYLCNVSKLLRQSIQVHVVLPLRITPASCSAFGLPEITLCGHGVSVILRVCRSNAQVQRQAQGINPK